MDTAKGTMMAARLQGVSVVVVDDDADIAEAMEAALSAEGAEVTTVSNGNDAVTVITEQRPRVVVLDMMLPGRSGFLVLEKIKGEADSPIVIMLTANEGKRHQAYAQSLGVDKYFIKPAPLDALIDSCRELVDARDAEDKKSRKPKK
ncbi:MAG TPA: response regulator [Phycisphaerales bacterium]|nr:response regulator [Phycisphaerales bacterium]